MNDFGFGSNFDFSQYENLRAHATDNKSPKSENHREIKKLEDLARFFDEVTKYVIRFINQHSQDIKL